MGISDVLSDVLMLSPSAAEEALDNNTGAMSPAIPGYWPGFCYLRVFFGGRNDGMIGIVQQLFRFQQRPVTATSI
jgi:hypothetical protein